MIEGGVGLVELMERSKLARRRWSKAPTEGCN